jgi:hypothetical protein
VHAGFFFRGVADKRLPSSSGLHVSSSSGRPPAHPVLKARMGDSSGAAGAVRARAGEKSARLIRGASAG